MSWLACDIILNKNFIESSHKSCRLLFRNRHACISLLSDKQKGFGGT